MNNLKVRMSGKRTHKDPTSISLMVESHSHEEICDYDESKIADALVRELFLNESEADEVAAIVTSRILAAMKESTIKTIDTSLIRCFVNVVLYEKGFSKKLMSSSDITISTYDIRQIIENANKENGNMEHNPESINFTLAERLIKEYTMKELLSPEAARAHLEGDLHIHDAGTFCRAYCSGHSIEYIKLNGIKNVPNIPSTSGPAMHANVLARHLCSITQFYSSIFAGAIGWEALNVFFAPYLIGFSEEELIQLAQTLLFDLSQMSGAKGGQVSFTDFNLYITVPNHYKDTYAIFPGGVYKGFNDDVDEICFNNIEDAERWEKEDSKNIILTYGDYEEEAQEFLKAILKVASCGDHNHLPFSFPKLNLHINEDTFTEYDLLFADGQLCGKGHSNDNTEEIILVYHKFIKSFEKKGYTFDRIENKTANELLYMASEVASINGGIYFLFDRDEFSMAQCCRLKVKLDANDKSLTRTPADLRFVGLQNVSINLPSVTVKIKDKEAAISEIERRMRLAADAHVTRRKYLEYLTNLPNSPLKYYKYGMDGKAYVNFDTASYLIGIVGLNECVYNLIGQEMHESDEAYSLGLEIIIRMNRICDKLGKQYNLNLKLEETPAESTANRFALIDKQRYGEDAFVKENEKGVYYSNSVHFAYDSDMNYIERLIKQSRFHPFIEAGTMIHLWVGDRLPDTDAIVELVEKTWRETDCEQFTISPELSTCSLCHTTFAGFREICPFCDSIDILWTTRITGYLVNVKKFNKGKCAELIDRNKKTYII